MSAFYCSICGLDLLRSGTLYSHRCRDSKLARIEAEYATECDDTDDDDTDPPQLHPETG